MRLQWFVVLSVIGSWTVVGCESADYASETPSGSPEARVTEVDPADVPAPPAIAADGLTPVVVESGVVALGPATTQVNFVGTHAGRGNPDPGARHGGFGEFEGKIELHAVTKIPTSIAIEVATPSLRIYPEPSNMPAMMTPGLTNHLKSADFLDVNNIPTMKFASTRITPSTEKPGEATVTGKLTLHDVTKEITFPIMVGQGDSGFTLSSEFHINRLDYKINFDPGQVVEDVAINVVVGKATPDAP